MEREELRDLVIAGLLTNEGRHKQWVLEQVLIEIGCDLQNIQEDFDLFWEPGIAP